MTLVTLTFIMVQYRTRLSDRDLNLLIHYNVRLEVLL